MTHWRTLQERDYVGSWDLAGKGDVTLQIESVKAGVIKSAQAPKGKRKIVVRFRGATKAWIVNSTNAKALESLYGPDIESWVGQRVTLHVTKVRSPEGGTVDGIRVRPRVGSGPVVELGEGSPVDPETRAQQVAAFEGGEAPEGT